MKKLSLKSLAAFSIVDLLIGVSISLISLTVMVNSVVLADRQKKQTSAISDVQSSGQIASYYLNRDLRMGGYGITQDGLQNCLVHGYRANGTTTFTYSLMPVKVVGSGAALTSDTISIFYGDADVTTTTTKLTSASTGNATNYTVDNRYGFNSGDIAILYSAGVDTNSDSVPDCSMAEITSVPGTTGLTNALGHGTGSYTNVSTGVTGAASYNSAAGIGIAYPVGTQVINIGAVPNSFSYSVNASNTLIRTNNLSGATQDLGENVVAIKAYYLKDTNLDGIADTLDQTTPTGSNAWKQIVAIRYAIITRSTTTENDPVTSLTIVPSITLPNGTTTTAVTASLTGTQQYYRYKVYGGTVALRNVIWKDS